MSDSAWLTETQLKRIEPHLPLSHCVPRVDVRRVVSGGIRPPRNGAGDHRKRRSRSKPPADHRNQKVGKFTSPLLGKFKTAFTNRKPISQRPKSAGDRQEFGHWEGDLVHFRRQRDILLTLQERSTRLTLARRLHSKDAPATAATIVEELGGLPREALRTITPSSRQI